MRFHKNFPFLTGLLTLAASLVPVIYFERASTAPGVPPLLGRHKRQRAVFAAADLYFPLSLVPPLMRKLSGTRPFLAPLSRAELPQRLARSVGGIIRLVLPLPSPHYLCCHWRCFAWQRLSRGEPATLWIITGSASPHMEATCEHESRTSFNACCRACRTVAAMFGARLLKRPMKRRNSRKQLWPAKSKWERFMDPRKPTWTANGATQPAKSFPR